MQKLTDLPPLRSRRLLGRIPHRDKGQNFLALPSSAHCFGFCVFERAYDDCTESQAVGCETQALSGNAQVEHVPVPKLGRRLALVVAGTLKLSAERKHHGRLRYAYHSGISWRQGVPELFFGRRFSDHNDFPALCIVPRWRPPNTLENPLKNLFWNLLFLEPSNAAPSFDDAHEIRHC